MFSRNSFQRMQSEFLLKMLCPYRNGYHGPKVLITRLRHKEMNDRGRFSPFVIVFLQTNQIILHGYLQQKHMFPGLVIYQTKHSGVVMVVMMTEVATNHHTSERLFSQLDPGSVLEEHTGWADLANHVLRLHIPLVIPNNDIDNNDDLCGTWVDGCVQTHAVGRPLLFDDSKIHRAFNYSDRNRIVLIVDLVRPKSLPSGTAKSGHTEELDAFIEQMNIPKQLGVIKTQVFIKSMNHMFIFLNTQKKNREEEQ